MNLERYNYLVDKSFQYYKFYSRGPNRKIEKLVTFSLQNLNGKTYFDFSFGDYIEDTEEIDMLSVSDNGDTEKILYTLFTILVDFLSRFPDMFVYAIGSTDVRTRLYQMSIAKYWSDIEVLLYVYGLYNDAWELFVKNKRYKAFIFSKKP